MKKFLRSARFKIVLTYGTVIAAKIGSKIPKFGLFGPAVAEAEKLVDLCEEGSILSTPRYHDKLHSSFQIKATKLVLSS